MLRKSDMVILIAWMIMPLFNLSWHWFLGTFILAWAFNGLTKNKKPTPKEDQAMNPQLQNVTPPADNNREGI